MVTESSRIFVEIVLQASEKESLAYISVNPDFCRGNKFSLSTEKYLFDIRC